MRYQFLRPKYNVFSTLRKSVRYLTESSDVEPYKITKLENGLTVASRSSFGHLSAIGAFVKGGSRYCSAYPTGITHALKHMAFTGTEKYPTTLDIGNIVNKISGVIDCQFTRDISAFATMFPKYSLESATDLISQAVLHPVFSDSQLNEAKKTITLELEQHKYDPEPEAQFSQLKFQAAYGSKTLGLEELASLESMDKFSCELLYRYHSNFHVPNRIALCGVNVDHDKFVEYAQKSFDFKNTSWSGMKLEPGLPDDSPAIYIGGMASRITEQPRTQPGHTEFPEFAHIGVGFKGPSDIERSVYTSCVMHGILGSGRSFSSGGPGKGLCSRLNMDVLCQYNWVNSCISETLSFSDTGLFYIYGSCEPTQAPTFINVILNEFYRLCNDSIDSVEFSRAKNQVLSMALTALEQRSVLLEDLGRNILSQDTCPTPCELIDKIQSVTTDEVRKLATEMLQNPPSIAALGMIYDLPSHDKIVQAVSKRDIVKKFRLF